MPLTRANRTCRTVYHPAGSVKTAHCTEEHVLRPFSTDGGAGAATLVEQKLEFTGQGGMVKVSHDHTFKRSPLEYQHHDYKQPSKLPLEDAKSVLSDLCELGPAVVPTMPRLFNELIHRLRGLSTDQLKTIRAEVEGHAVCRRNNRMAKQFFYDALPSVSTPAAIELMKELVLEGKISTTEADMWLTSLAFVQEPKRQMLESLLPLLEVESPSQQAQLGIGALVNQYCKSQAECRKDPAVKSIGAALQKILSKDCSTGDKQTLLVALKAVGNAGYLTDLMPTLIQCAIREANLMDVRIAAIEALRRTPCSEDRTPLMKLIRNKDVDSELRIAAYLGLMACPTIELLDTVKELLTAESSNQFASFMWTHLTNLLETADPHKQDIRLIVEDVKLKKQYDMDKLKFSRNVEKSFFSKYLNAGAKVESNLIWSQRSFLPRSATLNMTMDLFGKSFNFFEIGGRVQGLETLLEKYLGPKGMERKQETDTSGQLAELDKTFKLIEDEIGGSLDIKIFGHQVAFLNLWKEDLERSGGNLMQLLMSLKQMREVNWQKSFSFLDTQVTLPTVSGFPLILGVNGTASFVIKSSGKLNMKKLMQWPPEVEIEGKLSPSGSVHVSGMLGIGTVYGDYGVKMVASIHSSTEMQATIKTANGEELQVEIQQPREKQDILNTKTSFFVVHRSVEREQNMRQDILVKRKACSSGDMMEKVLGVELCAEVRYPTLVPQEGAPLAPLAAGFELDLSMLRRDTHTSYLLHLINKKDGLNRHWKALIDTPGSRIDRKLQAEFLLDSVNKKIEATLASPWKKGKASLSLNTEEDTKRVHFSTEVDGTTYTSAQASYRRSETNEEVRHEVESLELRFLNSEAVTMKGMLSSSKLADRKKWEMTFSTDNLLTKPVMVSTSVTYTTTKAMAMAKVNSPIFNGQIDSNYDLSVGGIAGSTLVTYQLGEMAEQSLKVEPTVKFSAAAGEHSLKGSLKFIFSEVPQYNTHVAIVSKRSDYFNHEMDVHVEYGRSGEFVRFKHKYIMLQNGVSREHTLTADLSNNDASYGVQSNLNHDPAWTRVYAKLWLTGSDPVSSKFITKVDFNRQPGTLFYTASLKSQANEDSYAVVSKLQRLTDAIGFETAVTLRDTEHSVKVELQNQATKYKINGQLSLPGIAQIESELSLDIRNSEPSFSAKMTTSGVAYSADASAKLNYDETTIQGQVAAPGVDVKTKIALNREEDNNKLMAELYWNPRRAQTDGFKVDGAMRVNRKPHSVDRDGKLQIDYPTGSVTFNFKENKEQNKRDSYIEMVYGEGKKMSANFMYDINDGWTEKGIVSMLRLVTPFKRYEDITLKLEGYGSLRIRRLQIESNINERRFKTELLINLGNINNFHSRLSIVTPWAQASFIKFELTHWLTSAEIKSKLDMEFKTKKMVVEMHGYNKGSSSNRDAGFKVESISTFDWMPKISIGFAHKDDSKQFSTNADVVLNDVNTASLKSKFNFYPTYDKVESRGNISLTTPFGGYEEFSALWDHKSNQHMINSNSKITYLPGKTVELRLEAYNELTAHKDRQMGTSISISAPFMEEATVKMTAKYGSSKFESNVQTKVPFVGNYQVEALAMATGPRFHLKVETPHQSLTKFGAIHSSRKDSDMETSSNSEVYWNDEEIKLTSKLLPAANNQMLEVILQTPFEIVKHERLLLHTRTEGGSKTTVEFSHNLQKVFGLAVESKTHSDSREFKVGLESPFERLQSLEASTLYAWMASEKAVKASMVYNKEHSLNVELSSLYAESQFNFNGKVSTQCPYGSKKLVLAHKRTLQEMTTQLTIDAGLEKAIIIKTTIDARGIFEIESSTPFPAIASSKVHVSVSREGNVYKSDAIIQHAYHQDVLKLELEGELSGLEKARLEVRLATPAFLLGDAKVTFDHKLSEMGKWTTIADASYVGGRIDAKSELSFTAAEIKGRWELKTPFTALEEVSLHMRHRKIGQLIEHQHGYKTIAAGNTIEISNSLRLLGLRDIKFSSQFNSNIHGVERIAITGHQTVENSPMGYDGAFSINYGTTTIAAGLDWKIQPTGFEGSTFAKLPFDTIKNFNATVRTSFADWLHWTSKAKVSLESHMGAFHFEKDFSLSSLKDVSISLKLRSPITNLASSLQVEALRETTVLVQGMLSVDGEEKVMNIKLERVNSGHYKASLKVADQPTIVAENKWQRVNMGSFSNAFTVTMGEEEMVKSDVKLAISAEMMSLAVGTKAFGYRHNSSFEVSTLSNKFSLDINHKCNWMDGPVLLKLEAVRDTTSLLRVSASGSLKTPFFADASGTIDIDVEHLLKGNSKMELRLPNTEKMSYNVNWNFLSGVLASVQMQAPYLQSFTSRLWTENEELVLVVELPKFLSDKWELRVGGGLKSATKASLVIKLQTSLPSLRMVNIRHSHNFEDETLLNTEVELPGWSKKLTVDFSSTATKSRLSVDGPGFSPLVAELFLHGDSGSCEAKLLTTWQPLLGEHSLELKTKVSWSPSMTVLVDFKTPLTIVGYNDVIRGKFEGDLQLKPTIAFSAELQYAGGVVLPLVQLFKTSYGAQSGKRLFTASVPGGSFTACHGNKETMATVSWLDEVLEFKQKSTLNSLTDFDIVASLKSSVYSIKEAELHVRHQGRLAQFRNKVSLKVDLATLFDFQGHFDATNGELKAEFGVETPTTERMILRLGHQGELRDFSHYLDVTSKYYAPLHYKGQYRDLEGDFSASVPVLGETRMQIRRDGLKSVVSMSANNYKKVTLEVENAWTGVTGKTIVRVNAMDQTATVIVKNEGEGWGKFMSELSVQAMEVLFEAKAGYEARKSVHFSTQFSQLAERSQPRHSFSLTGHREGADFLADIQLVRYYETVFGLSAKHESLRLFSLILQTNRPGFRLTSIAGSLSESVASLEINNELTKRNTIKFQVVDMMTGKVVFDSEILGAYSVQYRSRNMENSRFTVSQHPEIEIRWPNSEPVVLRVDFQLSARSLHTAVHLKTPFNHIMDNKLSFTGFYTDEWKVLAVKVSQEYIGNHGFSLKAETKPQDLSGIIELESDKSEAVSKLTWKMMPHIQEVTFTNNAIGEVKYSGKMEQSSGSLVGSYTLEAPHSSIGVTTLGFQWLSTSERTKLSLKIRNPYLGENSLELDRQSTEVDTTEAKHTLSAALNIEKLNERLSLQSTVINGQRDRAFKTSGSHSFSCSRLGSYSLTEELQVEDGKVHASVSVRTPFKNWDKTALSLDLNAKQQLRLSAQLETSQYGVHSLALRMRDNDLTAHVTVMSVRHELTIAGWSPKTDQNGSTTLDFIASVNSPSIKASTRLELKRGQVSIEASTTGSLWLTGTARASAAWELKPQRVLVDLKANLHTDDFDNVWGATCDIDLASTDAKRLVLTLVAPSTVIEKTELAIYLKMQPTIDASVEVQSPYFGHMKVKSQWQSTGGLFTAPVSGKFVLDTSSVRIPSLEVAFGHVQRHEHLVTDLTVRDRASDRVLFKADSVYDAFKRKLEFNFGTSEMIGLTWHSMSDLTMWNINERVGLQWNRVEKFSAKAEYNWVEEKAVALKVTTPYAGYEKLGFKLVGSVSSPFHIEAKLMLPNQELKTTAILDLTDGLHVRTALVLPYLPEMEVAFQAAGSLRSYKFETTAQYGKKRLSGLAHWNTLDKLMAKLRIETPVSDLRLLEVYGMASSEETDSHLELSLAFNDYASKVKLTKSSSSKGLRLQVHLMGKLYEVELMRQGHRENRVVIALFRVNGQSLVDISTKLTSMFTNKSWKVRPPHSGFVEVRQLFGSVLEQSKVEWDFSRMAVVLRVDHNKSHFRHRMAILPDGQLSFKTSANLPLLNIDLEEVSGSIQVSRIGRYETQVTADFSMPSRKYQLVGTTNWKNSINLHVSGLKDLKYVKQESLTLQAHLIRTDGLQEISLRVVGLSLGHLATVLNLKSEKAVKQLTIGVNIFGTQFDANMNCKSRQGWLSSAVSRELQGKVTLSMLDGAMHSATWSSKVNSERLETDVQVVSSILPDNQPLSTKISATYQSGLHATVDLSALGRSFQTQVKLGMRQADLVLKSNGAEIVSLSASCLKSGYKTKSFSQRLHVLYKSQVVLSLETKQEVSSWNKQIGGSVKLQVSGVNDEMSFQLDAENKMLNVELDVTGFNPIKLTADFKSLTNPKIHVVYGSHEVLAHMQHLAEGRNAFRTEFGVANPWMPVSVKMYHQHEAGRHRVQHEYTIGDRSYQLNSHLLSSPSSLDANLHYKSPVRELKAKAAVAIGASHSSLSHSVHYNGVRYMKLEASTEHKVSDMKEFSSQRDIKAHMETPYTERMAMELRHHYNKNWSDSAWHHKLSHGEQHAFHTGRVHWSNGEVHSNLVVKDHEHEMKIGGGHYLLRHSYDQKNVGHLTGTYSPLSSSLKFTSDLTSFHTDARLKHRIGNNEGSVSFEQTGSHPTPEMSGKWNFNMPSLQGDLKLGDAHVSLEHVHRSNKDFSTRCTVARGESKHEFKAGFAAKPSSRAEYHTEVAAHASLESTSTRPFGLRLEHHHNGWKDHSCELKVLAAEWKLLHKSAMKPESRVLSTETSLHNAGSRQFYHLTTVNAGRFSSEIHVESVTLYKLSGHCTPTDTKVVIVSPYHNIDSTTEISHSVRDWHHGKFSVAHAGLLPRFNIQANANWDLAGETRQVYGKLNDLEVDLSTKKVDGKIHYRHQIELAFGKLHGSGVYDPSALVRLTEVSLRATTLMSPQRALTWEHKIGTQGHLKFQDETSALHASGSWDFSSPKRTMSVNTSIGQMQFVQTSPSAGKINVIAKLPSGTHNVTGVLSASPTWKSGTLSLQDGEPLMLKGDWNTEEDEKKASLQVGGFQLKLQHTQRDRFDFSFGHRMECNSCLLSSVLPVAVECKGTVTAEPNLISGLATGSLSVNDESPLSIKAKWNMQGESKVAELTGPMINARLSHQHRSLKDFNFKHTVTVMSRTHEVSGGFKIQPELMKAHLTGPNCKVDLSHQVDASRMHSWSHTVQAGEWRVAAEGHLHRGASLKSNVAVHLADQLMLSKNFIWTPEKLEYEDSARGTKYHHLKLVNSDAEKAAWFKYNGYFSHVVGAGASLKRTCPTCYQVEARISYPGAPALLVADAQLHFTHQLLLANANLETPYGKLFSNNKLEGKLNSFQYIGSIGTGSGKLELESELRLESVNNLVVKATLKHSGLVPALPNSHTGFTFTQNGDNNLNLQQALELTIDNWKPLVYSGRIAATNAKQWAVEFALNEQLTSLGSLTMKVALDSELNASLRWMETSFVQLKADTTYSILVTSSCPTLPHLSAKLRPTLWPQKASVDAELQLGEQILQGTLTIETGMQKVFAVQVKTPFPAVSHIGTSMSITSKQPGKFSAQAAFEINNLRYSTSLTAEKEWMGFIPRGFVSWKAETPHTGFQKLQILALNKDQSGRLMAAINDREFSLSGNITSTSVSVRLSLPIVGYEKIGLKMFSDEEESQPRLRMVLKLPHGHFGKVSTVGRARLSGLATSMDGSMRVETSFSQMKNAEFELGHGFKDGLFRHASSLVVDGQRWHRLSFNGSGEKGEFSLDYKHPIRIDYRLSLGAVRIAELKITYRDAVPFHLNTQVQMDDYSVSGKSFLTLRTPYRTVALSREFKVLPKGYSLKLEFTPDQQTTRPLIVAIQSLDKSDYYKTAGSATVSLTVPTRRVEISIELEKSREEAQLTASLNWDAAKASSDKLVRVKAKSVYVPKTGVSGTLELQVASMKPYTVTFATQLQEGHVLFSNRLTLDITDNRQDTIVLQVQATRTAADTTQVSGSLFQDSGKVDVKLDGQLKQTSTQKEGRLSLEYLGTDGQLKKMQSVVSIGPDSVRLDMTSPARRCNFELARTRQPDGTTYVLSTHGKTFELRLRSDTPDMELVYQPRQHDRVSAAIGYPNNRHLRVDIHRTTDQVKMQHLLAEVQLKSRHLMKTRVHWNPTYALLHYSTLRDRLPSMYKEASEFVNSVRFSCVRDLLAKLSTDLVLPDLGSATQFVSEELQPLHRDLSYMSGQFDQMYARNEFYSRDICRFVRKTASAAGFYAGAAARYGYDRTSQVYSEHVHPHVRRVAAGTRYYAGQVHGAARRHYRWCHSRVSHAYGLYRHHADRLYAKVNHHALRYIGAAVDSIRPALDSAHGGLQSAISAYSSFHSKVVGHPVVQQLHRRVARSVELVNYQSFGLLHSHLRTQVVSAHQYLESKIGQVTEHTANVIGSAKSRMRQGLSSFMENRHAQLASSLVSGAYEQSKWFLDHFNIEQSLKDFAKDNYLQTVEYLRQNSIGLATDYLGLSKNAIIEQDFQQGRFEAHLYSPMAWNDLQSLPTSGLEEVQDRLGSSYNSMRHSYNTVRRKLRAVRDVVYDSIPDLDMPSGSWIPKFKGVASVIGEHVVTFDGHHYDFRGSECSYLLARDFRSHAWAITMAYGRAGKTMTIFAYGKRITVTPQLHVLVDGVQQELPLSIGNLNIVRTASGLHAKDLGHLFTVSVDPEADSHTVSVSGWYHGRLGGLLGNLDNERFNDQLGSDGKRTEDVLRFTRSWMLGACRHVNLAGSQRRSRETPHPECERLFGSPRSPFKRCYADVDPAPFQEICAQERHTSGQPTCKAAVAYMRHCAAKGLRGLKAPAQCLRCNFRTGAAGYRQLLTGQRERLTATGTSADVVLVLEERGCLGRDTLRRLPELVAQMERSLTAAGVTDVRFSLLGFGNPAHHRRGSQAHWHTMAGELTGSADQLVGALATVDTHDTADVGAETRADALDAVHQAARFAELRPDAARHVVLVTCDECHEGRRTLLSVRQALEESGVQLHLMSELQLPTYYYGRRSQAFGVDAGRAYSPESLGGSAALHGFTRQPAGKCARLAKSTGGGAFDLKYLRRKQYSRLADMFSRAFADRLAAASAQPTEQECLCTSSACGQSSRLRCRPLRSRGGY